MAATELPWRAENGCASAHRARAQLTYDSTITRTAAAKRALTGPL